MNTKIKDLFCANIIIDNTKLNAVIEDTLSALDKRHNRFRRNELTDAESEEIAAAGDIHSELIYSKLPSDISLKDKYNKDKLY